MAIHVEKLNLIYFPVPKAACTSIKNFIYQVKFGVPFPAAHPELAGRKTIHQMLKTVPFGPPQVDTSRTGTTFCFIREPIERLLSAYSNRVLQLGQLSAVNRVDKKLTPNPSLEEFLDRFEDYRTVSTAIRHHTEPFVFFVGHVPGYYKRIFTPNDMSAFSAWMKHSYSIHTAVPHKTKSRQIFKQSALAPAHVAMLENFYREDYRFWEASGIAK